MSDLQELEAKMKTAKIAYEEAKHAYMVANIENSPFRMMKRILYQGKEFEITRVYSESNCATSCTAFPINRDGSVSKTRDVMIYSDVSTFAIKKSPLVEGREPASLWAKNANEADRRLL